MDLSNRKEILPAELAWALFGLFDDYSLHSVGSMESHSWRMFRHALKNSDNPLFSQNIANDVQEYMNNAFDRYRHLEEAYPTGQYLPSQEQPKKYLYFGGGSQTHAIVMYMISQSQYLIFNSGEGIDFHYNHEPIAYLKRGTKFVTRYFHDDPLFMLMHYGGIISNTGLSYRLCGIYPRYIFHPATNILYIPLTELIWLDGTSATSLALNSGKNHIAIDTVKKNITFVETGEEGYIHWYDPAHDARDITTRFSLPLSFIEIVKQPKESRVHVYEWYEGKGDRSTQYHTTIQKMFQFGAVSLIFDNVVRYLIRAIAAAAQASSFTFSQTIETRLQPESKHALNHFRRIPYENLVAFLGEMYGDLTEIQFALNHLQENQNYELYVALPEVLDMYQEMRVAKPELKSIAYAGFIVRTAHPVYVHHVTRKNTSHPFSDTPTFLRKHANSVDPGQPQKSSSCTYYAMYHCLRYLTCGEHAQTKDTWNEFVFQSLTRLQYRIFKAFMRWDLFRYIPGGLNIPILLIEDSKPSKQLFNGHFTLSAFEMVLYERQQNEVDRLAKEELIQPNLALWFTRIRDWDRQIKSGQNFFKLYTNAISLAEDEHGFTTPGQMIQRMYQVKAGIDEEDEEDKDDDDSYFHLLAAWFSDPNYLHDKLTDIKSLIAELETIYSITDHKGASAYTPHRSARRVMVNYLLKYALLHCADIFHAAKLEDMINLFVEIHNIQAQRLHGVPGRFDIFPQTDQSAHTIHIEDINALFLLALFHILLSKVIPTHENEIPLVEIGKPFEPLQPPILFHLAQNEFDELNTIVKEHIREEWLYFMIGRDEDINETPRFVLPAAYETQWPESIDAYAGSSQGVSLRIYPWQWMVAIMQYALLQRGDVDVYPPFNAAASGSNRIELASTALELPVHRKSTTIKVTGTSTDEHWTAYAFSSMYDPLDPPINMASFCIYARNLFLERYLNIYQSNIDEVTSILDIEISRSQGREIDIDNDINLKHVGAWEPPCIAARGDLAGLSSLSIYKNTIDALPLHVYASYYSNIYWPIIRKYKQLAQPTQLIHHWWSGDLHYDRTHASDGDDATKILRGYYVKDDGERYYYTGSVEAITENPFLNLVFLRKDIDIQSMMKFFLWRHMIDPETELPDENPAKAECLASENRLKNEILLQESQTRLDTGVFYHHTFAWIMHELEYNMHLVEERQVKTLLQCVHDTMVVYAEFDALSQFYSKLDTSKSQQHTQLIPEQGSNLPILKIVKEQRYNTLHAHIDDQDYYAMIKKYDEDEDEDDDEEGGDHIFNMNPQYRTSRQPLFDINDHVLTIATSLREYTAYFLDTRCLENPNHVLTVRAEITDLEDDQANYYIGKYRILLDTPKTMNTVIGLPHTFCLSSTSDDDVDAILVILPKQFASPASYGQFSFFPVGAPPAPAPASGNGDVNANTSAYIVIPIRHPHKESILIFESYAEVYAYMVAINLAGRYDLLIRIWPQWQFFSRSLQRANLPYLPLNSFQHDMYRNAYRYFAYGEVDESSSSQWKGYLDWTTVPLHSIPRDIIDFDSIVDTTCHAKTAEGQMEYLIKVFENYFFMKPMREDQVASVKHIFINARNATFQQMLMGGGKTSVLFPFLALAYMMRFRRKDTRVLFVTHSDALVQQSIAAFHRVLAWTGVISINDDQLLTHARLGTILVQSDVNVKSIYLRSGHGFDIQAYHPISLLLVDEYDSCINPFTSAYIIGQDHVSLRHKMAVTEAVESMMRFVQIQDMQTLQRELLGLVRQESTGPIPWAVATLQVKFGMTYRIDYGVDPDRLIASPYVAFDQIAKGASFRDPTIQFLTTILTIREHGSTVKQNRALLKTYIDFHKEKEHLPIEWQKVANPEEYMNIPFKEFESIAKFVERVLFHQVQSPRFVQECSFVELLVQDVTRRGLILDPKVILGMTGTLTKHSGQIPAHAFQSREYQVFLDDKANKIIHTVLSTAEYLKLDDIKDVFTLLSNLPSGKNGALIDAAAMFIHQSIPELVEWIARQDEIAQRYQIIFYISDKSDIMQYVISKRVHERFKGMISRFNGHILYFYDQSHCIGFDIPQAQPDPIPIHGYVTLKPRLRKSFVSQAAFRLRTLFDASIQTVAFVSVKEDENIDENTLQENEQMFLDTCTEKLGEQTLRALARMSANQEYEVIPWFQHGKSILEYAKPFTELKDIRVIVEREYEAETELELEIELEKEQERELTLERLNVLSPDMIGSVLRLQYEYELYKEQNLKVMFHIPMLGTMTTLPFKHTWITLSSNDPEWTIAWTPVDMDEHSMYDFVTQCCFNFDTFAFENKEGTIQKPKEIPENVFQWYLVMVIFLSIIQCRTVTLAARMKLAAFAQKYPIQFFELVQTLREPFYNTEYHKFMHTLVPPHIDALIQRRQKTPAPVKAHVFASQVLLQQLESIPKHQYQLFQATFTALADRLPVATSQKRT